MGDSIEIPFGPGESHGGPGGAGDLVVRTRGFSDLNNFEECHSNAEDGGSASRQHRNTMGYHGGRGDSSELQSP